MQVFWRIILFVSFSVAVAAAISARAADEAGDAANAPAQLPASKPAPAAGSGGKETKKNVVNFEDQLVEGQTQKPELFYLLQQRNNNFKRLIRLRENFLPEMKATGEEISRGGKTPAGQNQNQGGS